MSEFDYSELLKMQKRYEKFFRRMKKIETKTSSEILELKKFNFDIKYAIYDILKERNQSNLSFNELQYLLNRANECYLLWQNNNDELKGILKNIIDNEIVNKKEEENKNMKRNRKTLKEQVNEKLGKEYKKFIKELKSKTQKELIEGADKIVYIGKLKENIEAKKLTIIEARAILNTESFLEYMYEISKANVIIANEEIEKKISEDMVVIIENYKTQKNKKNEKSK